MERIKLPIPADVSGTALQWATDLLGESPRELRVSAVDEALAARILGWTPNQPWTKFPVAVVPAFKRGEWLLMGQTREVYSEGI